MGCAQWEHTNGQAQARPMMTALCVLCEMGMKLARKNATFTGVAWSAMLGCGCYLQTIRVSMRLDALA